MDWHKMGSHLTLWPKCCDFQSMRQSQDFILVHLPIMQLNHTSVSCNLASIPCSVSHLWRQGIVHYKHHICTSTNCFIYVCVYIMNRALIFKRSKNQRISCLKKYFLTFLTLGSAHVTNM